MSAANPRKKVKLTSWQRKKAKANGGESVPSQKPKQLKPETALHDACAAAKAASQGARDRFRRFEEAEEGDRALVLAYQTAKAALRAALGKGAAGAKSSATVDSAAVSAQKRKAEPAVPTGAQGDGASTNNKRLRRFESEEPRRNDAAASPSASPAASPRRTVSRSQRRRDRRVSFKRELAEQTPRC